VDRACKAAELRMLPWRLAAHKAMLDTCAPKSMLCTSGEKGMPRPDLAGLEVSIKLCIVELRVHAGVLNMLQLGRATACKLKQ